MAIHSHSSDLADYLHRRLDYLRRCNAEIERTLSEGKRDLCERVDDGTYNRNDPDIGKVVFHLNFVVGNTFRYTMLVGICSFLEEAVKAIANHVVPDYDARMKRLKRGDWLRKHIRVLSDDVGFDPNSIEVDLHHFHHLITLRNCVVHAWGKVDACRNPDAVKHAASRVQGVELSKDGYLTFGDEVIPGAIWAAEPIANSVMSVWDQEVD